MLVCGPSRPMASTALSVVWSYATEDKTRGDGGPPAVFTAVHCDVPCNAFAFDSIHTLGSELTIGSGDCIRSPDAININSFLTGSYVRFPEVASTGPAVVCT